jgi:hypothetical protein
MATSSFTKKFKLPYNKRAIKAFIELFEHPKEIKIESNKILSEEVKKDKKV